MIGFDKGDEEVLLHQTGIVRVDDEVEFTVSSTDSTENLWPDVLQYLYSSGGTVVVSVRDTEASVQEVEYPLPDALNASMDDLHKAISVLHRAELIEMKEDTVRGFEMFYLKLTKRGFEVAHERELAENQQETNENLAFFTLILGLAAILQTVAAAVQLGQVSMKIGLLLLTLILTLALAFYQSQPLRWFHNLVDSLR